MKKTITVILIVILLFNFISINSAVIAANILDDAKSNVGDMNGESFMNNLYNGKGEVTNAGGDNFLVSALGTESSDGGIIAVVGRTIALFPQIGKNMIDYAINRLEKSALQHDDKEFSVYNIVMGNIELFNLDYHEISNKKISEIDFDNTSISEAIKIYSVYYYTILRNLSLAISLFVLIYVGIRMAISTVASEKAKYSKMLYNWVASIVLLFIMHFIIIALCYVLAEARELLIELAKKLKVEDIEIVLWANALRDFNVAKMFQLVSAIIIMVMLFYYKLKFFILYMYRFLEVSFLVIIAPIITITYPIDKIRDNKSQAFRTWFTELVMKISLQLMHGVLYCVLVSTAGAIIEYQPILAILFFGSLTRCEKIVRNIFSIKDKGSIEKVKIPIINK